MGTKQSTERVKEAFIKAADGKQYKKALSAARRLSGEDQLLILDALFDAAKRLQVQRSTGEPILEGAQQQLDGSITITWSERTRTPSGKRTMTVHTAVMEPAEYGPGWRCRGAIPDSIVRAVEAAALEWA